MIRVLGVIATGAAGIVAQAAVDPTTSWAGLEKLGVAAVTIAIMYWLLKAERDERRTATTRLDVLHEEIRKEHGAVISNHADAMRENAKAQERMSEVLDKVLEKVVKG